MAFFDFNFYFLHHAALATFEVILKSLLFLPVLWWLGWLGAVTPVRLLIFIVNIPSVLIATFSLYFILSSSAFWFQRSHSLQMTMMFTGRFLSGIFIPLSFLPVNLQKSLARSEEHTSELQSLMRISYAVFSLKKKTIK